VSQVFDDAIDEPSSERILPLTSPCTPITTPNLVVCIPHCAGPDRDLIVDVFNRLFCGVSCGYGLLHLIFARAVPQLIERGCARRLSAATDVLEE
jgi:hypothetical protein